MFWSTLKMDFWAARERSPTSSRNRVPLSACLISPSFLSTAPVKAPLAWPNSKFSTRVSGRLVQSTAMNGAPALLLFICTALAIKSLPVPVSPEINRLPSVRADLATRSRHFFKTGLRPMIKSDLKPSRVGETILLSLNCNARFRVSLTSS